MVVVFCNKQSTHDALLPNSRTHVVIELFGNTRFILPTDVLADYEKDPMGCLSEFCGISRDRFKQWYNYRVEGLICTGVTQKGQPCKCFGSSAEDPRSFVPGESDRCYSHIDLVQ